MEWPSLEELVMVAPTAVIVLGIAAVGWHARGESVKILREWVERNRKD